MTDKKGPQIELVSYRRPEKLCDGRVLPGNAIYVCDDGDKHFKVWRDFDQSGKTTWEGVEDGQCRLIRYFNNGKPVTEDISVGLGPNESFVSVSWHEGRPVKGYSMTDKAKDPDATFEFYGETLVFYDKKHKRKFDGFQKGSSDMTQEEAESGISQMVSKTDAKKQELISLSEKVPQKSSMLSRLVVGTKTYLGMDQPEKR